MQDQFQTRIVPIMDKVRDELCRLRADEQSQYNSSLSVLFAGAAGPRQRHGFNGCSQGKGKAVGQVEQKDRR